MGHNSIDFGDWDKGFDAVSWIPSALKLLKKGGNIVIFSSWQNLGDISKSLEANGCQV